MIHNPADHSGKSAIESTHSMRTPEQEPMERAS